MKDKPHDFVINFMNECKEMSRLIVLNNPDLVKIVKKEEQWKTIGSTTSYFFQIIENHILYITYQFMVKKRIIKPKACELEYDGLCFPPTIEYNKDDLITELNQYIVDTTGLNIKYKFKDYEETAMQELIDQRDLLDVLSVADAVVETVKECSSSAFFRISPIFEETHIKIINRGVYVKKTDDKFIVMSEHQLVSAYKHMECGFSDFGTPVGFIGKWIGINDKIRKRDEMNIYPNNSKCPSNTFNIWIPFAMEKQTPYTRHEQGLQIMLDHIKILCNNEIPVFQYFLGWIAKMIQYPEIKSTCITLISDEGAGKGTLMELFKAMMGENKVLETKDPNRDVWGTFNSIMMDAFLVNLNELEFKETTEAEGRIKALITDSQMVINKKGIDQFKITSYHHFIITSNKENPIKTQRGDRRKLIIRSSDELIGNTKYFVKIYALLDDENFVRTCYEFFKNYDLSNYIEKTIPETEYQNDLKELSITAPEQWLNDFVLENQDEIEMTLTSQDVFTDFRRWCITNNKKYDTTPLSLGVKITNLRINGVSKKKTNACNMRVFNIPLLKTYFKIESG